MNIVIPVAGLGSRFSNVGYQIPKPFIPIKGKPMIEHVIDNISKPGDKIYIVMLLEHLAYLSSSNLLHRGNVAIVPQLGRLQGATKTVLLTKDFINTDDPLVIANGDQWVRYNREEWEKAVAVNDGTIMTFTADHPKWSYAAEEDGRVTQVAEKVVISNNATVGIYAYGKGRYFVEAAEKMMEKNILTNGEFYVCPAYNEMLDKNIKIFPVDSMFGLGTPEDLEQNYNEVGIW